MHKRRNERDILKKKLGAGVNIHMPAPRRIGKTWTINRLAEDLRKEDWLVVELDVQGVSCPTRFARQLCQKIHNQLPPTQGIVVGIRQRIQNALGGDWEGNPVEALGKMEPIPFLEALVEELEGGSKQSAIFIDEIAYFVLSFAEGNEEAAKDFFYQLRAIQLANRSVRWLYTGSIGLDVVAERFGLSGAFVDLERFILEPFTEDEAGSFLLDETTQAAFNQKFYASKDQLGYVFEQLGWLAPYYLKLVGNEVRPTGESKDGILEATREDFDAAFNRLLEPSRKADFAVWREHIDKNLPQSDREVARQLLNKLSQGANGEMEDTLRASFPSEAVRKVKLVLDMLQMDGLVYKCAGRYRFRSGLIRRYWKEYEV